jgi:hypothetical protein
MATLILKRASASRSSGQWRDDDYDVLEDGVVVGRITKEQVAPKDRPRMWATTATSSAARTATNTDTRGGHAGIRQELASGDIVPARRRATAYKDCN